MENSIGMNQFPRVRVTPRSLNPLAGIVRPKEPGLARSELQEELVLVHCVHYVFKSKKVRMGAMQHG